MQPHTGAIVTVINYLSASINLDPQSFSQQTFYVRSTIYSKTGHHLYDKYHFIKTIRHNESSRELEFEVGKDYSCFLTVRYSSSFEKFEFVKHRHTYVKEEFDIYVDSRFKFLENFRGEYVSELGNGHKIRGRIFNAKRLEFEDTFLTLKYVFEII